MKDLALALDLGGTKCAGALVDGSGRILNKDIVRLEDRQGPDVGQLIRELATRLLEGSKEQHGPLRGIGVSVPGISHRDKGTVWAPNIPGWEAYPLYRELLPLAGPGGRVVIESDRACCILGETWKGAATGIRDAIFLAVGTGIGAGILTDGRILRGSHDIAGAIGWMALETEYLEGYEKYGCFEYHASGDGLMREALDLLEKDFNQADTALKPETLSTADIFKYYEQQDPLALQVLRKAIRLWGKAVANLVSLFNPAMIIFGGGVFGPAAVFLDDIRQEAARWAQPVSMQQVDLRSSALKEDAALVGAGGWILKEGQG